MFYFRDNDGLLYSSTVMPKNLDRLTQLTKEEYDVAIATLEQEGEE